MLEEGDLAVVTAQGIRFYNAFGEPVERQRLTADWDQEAAEKGGYPHFMLKEINEQPPPSRRRSAPAWRMACLTCASRS